VPEVPHVPPSRSRSIRTRLARHGWLLAIAVVYLWAFPYFPAIRSANELPRVYLVKAIAHDHSFIIDNGVRQWGGTADVSPSGGHWYSNKAPGSSLLAVPVYKVMSWIKGEPSLAASLWWSRVTTGVIPALLFLWLLWGFLERFTPDPAVRRLAVIAYALGSMAMTYSILFYSHQLAAICIASAWIFLADVIAAKRDLRWMIAVGLFAGAAPLVDYQAAFAGVPLAIYMIVKVPRRDLPKAIALAAAAAAIPIGVLLWYHTVCFGGPFRTGYDASQTFAHFHQQGFLGISELKWERFYGSMLKADNGLLVLSPWLLLAIPGGVALWRRGDRATTILCAAVAVVFILFISSITFWRGGWGVGPRYITAMLPFCVPLVAIAIDTWRTRPLVLGALCGTIVSAVTVYCLSSLTFPYWPDSLNNPLYETTLRLLGDDAVAPNLANAVGVYGVAGIVPLLAGIAALLAVALYRVVGWRGVAAAYLVGAVIIAAFALVRPGPTSERAYTKTVYPAVTQ
jgi:hypothetical protein